MHFLTFSTIISIITIAVQVLAAPATNLESRQTFTGDGTFYTTGLGTCGVTNTDSDLIVAVSHLLFDSYPGATADPNKNPICGRKLEAHYGGKSVQVSVEDRCAGCSGMYDLDFSPTAFTKIGNEAAGRLSGMTWNWI